MRNYVFDIETVPLPTDQLQAIMDPFEPEAVKTGNYGPEKAAEKIEKARQSQFNDFMHDAALSALTGRVAMIGIRNEAGDNFILEDRYGEKELISAWFQWFESEVEHGAHWIGHNIANFDIPFLIRRAWFHRLPVPYGIIRGRYLSSFFTDLMQLWAGSEYGSKISLAKLAKYFDCGEKSANGANFGELLRYKPEAAQAYLENDLELTWKIAEAMGALKRPLASDLAAPGGLSEPEPGNDTGRYENEPESEPEPAGIQFY
jgi:hypothetical protein